jgi:hypothetical protein
LCFLRGENIYTEKSKAIPVTGRGCPYVCFLRVMNIIYTEKSKALFPLQAVDAHTCFL